MPAVGEPSRPPYEREHVYVREHEHKHKHDNRAVATGPVGPVFTGPLSGAPMLSRDAPGVQLSVVYQALAVVFTVQQILADIVANSYCSNLART